MVNILLFWFRRVQVRALAGQQKREEEIVMVSSSLFLPKSEGKGSKSEPNLLPGQPRSIVRSKIFTCSVKLSP